MVCRFLSDSPPLRLLRRDFGKWTEEGAPLQLGAIRPGGQLLQPRRQLRRHQGQGGAGLRGRQAHLARHGAAGLLPSGTAGGALLRQDEGVPLQADDGLHSRRYILS